MNRPFIVMLTKESRLRLVAYNLNKQFICKGIREYYSNHRIVIIYDKFSFSSGIAFMNSVLK